MFEYSLVCVWLCLCLCLFVCSKRENKTETNSVVFCPADFACAGPTQVQILDITSHQCAGAQCLSTDCCTDGLLFSFSLSFYLHQLSRSYSKVHTRTGRGPAHWGVSLLDSNPGTCCFLFLSLLCLSPLHFQRQVARASAACCLR